MSRLPYDFDSAAQLPGEGESLIRQLTTWAHDEYPDLRAYMRREALDRLRDYVNTESRSAWDVRQHMLMAHVYTQDPAGIRCLLNYWWDWDRHPRQRVQTANVTKFNPGEHYHVLNEKFDSLARAQAYLRGKGYEFGQLIEQFLYGHEGG